MGHLPDIVLFASELQAMSVLVTSGSSNQSTLEAEFRLLRGSFRGRYEIEKQRERSTKARGKHIALRDLLS
jgi:hypothetical protein